MSRQKVLGLGGVFIRAKNAEALRKWYFRHLGLDITEWGGAILQNDTPETYWSVFEEKSDYMPRRQVTMLNWRVGDLDAMLDQLRAADVRVEDRIEESEQGRFGWAYDLEGNKFELWQAPVAG
ncbi:MAG TPA: VOC family protein [Casimicrobium huifangae]|nr:VOC family protein [Casimicrobium huifangae]HQA34236.1 VOC family protein [Casimicrobium huifangae]HQD65553.1 VOC family protein [Casimicrobium huifangae]